jgi:hypothetical protein
MTYLPEVSSLSVSSVGLEWTGKYIASVLDLELGVLVQPSGPGGLKSIGNIFAVCILFTC